MTETQLIQRALDYCGYECAPIEENLIECFLDYVDSGAFLNLDYDEAKDLIDNRDLSVKQMCINLLAC